MDTQTIEQTKQIIESIKTLNLNLNDATTQKLADVVLPIAQQIIVMKYVEMILGFILWSIFLIGTFVIVKFLIKKASETN